MAVQHEDEQTLLRSLPHFAEVSDSTLEALAPHLTFERLERGDCAWREYERISTVTFVLEGELKMLKYRSEDQQVVVDLLHAGAVVGVRSIFEDASHAVGGVALNDVALLDVPSQRLAGPATNDIDLMGALWRHSLSQKQRLVRRIHDLSVSGAEPRLALVLDHLAYECGIRQPQEDGSMAVVIPVPLSRSDLAEIINTRVETAIRRMSEWRKQGIVETLDEGLLIRKPEAIREIAREASEHADTPAHL
jgi:CRP-like cAMP-binding protein